MHNKSSFFKFFLVGFLFTSCAYSQILNGTSPTDSTLNITPLELAQKIKPHTILVLGEIHGMKQIQDQQLEILNQLRLQNYKISIGFEFLDFTDQSIINSYKKNQLSDDEFKNQIHWSGFDFQFYKPQIQFPEEIKNEQTLGLNVPRQVTTQIAKLGFNSLTPEQRSLLPVNFELGNALYKERFVTAAGGHLTPEKIENYFAAQSAWDESMSDKTVQYLKNSTDDIFVIIVGEFHMQYYGGLPDRLKKRLALENLNWNIVTTSLIPVQDLTDDEIKSEILPSPKYGPRADYIWLSRP